MSVYLKTSLTALLHIAVLVGLYLAVMWLFDISKDGLVPFILGAATWTAFRNDSRIDALEKK